MLDRPKDYSAVSWRTERNYYMRQARSCQLQSNRAYFVQTARECSRAALSAPAS